MPWVEKRQVRTGGTRYIAVYRDPAERKRSAGTFSSRRAAVAMEVIGHSTSASGRR